METPHNPPIAFAEDQVVGFWGRALAAGIDLIAEGFASLLGMVVGLLIVAAVTGEISESAISRTGNLGIAFLASFAYRVSCETVGGATVGKLLLGYRVRRIDGGPIRFGAALGRTVVLNFDLLFFGIPAYRSMKDSPLRQRLGDKFSNTVVVRKNALNSKESASSAVLGAGIGCVLVVLMNLVHVARAR